MKMRFFDVTLRDGIQARKFVPNATKLKVLDHLVKSGLKRLEVTSFSKLPQFDHRNEFIEALPTYKGVKYYGLVSNKKGYELFKTQNKIQGLSLLASANNAFTVKNVGKTSRQLFHETVSIVKNAKHELPLVSTRVYISCAFGFKYPGDVDEPLKEMTEELIDHGVDEVVISDTTGMCRDKHLFDLDPSEKLSLHFHGADSVHRVEVAQIMGFENFDASLVDGYCPASGSNQGNVNLITLAKKYAHLHPVNENHLIDAKDLLEEPKMFNHWGFQPI